MAAELGVAERVVFRGQLGRAELPRVYRENAILVLPALADAMPNVVLEAMAAGLAVVTTPTGGGEVIRGNGVTVERAEPEALRAALLTYLTDAALLAEHRAASRRLAEGMPWSAVAGYCLELYREAVAAPELPVPAPAREFRLSAR